MGVASAAREELCAGVERGAGGDRVEDGAGVAPSAREGGQGLMGGRWPVHQEEAAARGGGREE